MCIRDRFQEALAVMRQAWAEDFPRIATPRVNLSGADTLPKPQLRNIPVMVTGNSRQSIEWIAEHGDGWLFYPQNLAEQASTIKRWRSLTPAFKPFAQSLYIDLAEQADAPPSPMHLGFRAGRNFVIQYLHSLKAIGVNHVGLNLKYSRRPAHEVVQELGEFVVPAFPAHAVAGD